MENDTNIKKVLDKRIKELGENRNLTQEKLAEIVGIGQRNLSKIECGNNFITAETLSNIANALKVEPKDLFDFNHKNDKQILKRELLEVISEEKIDIELMYHFYKSIKTCRK